MEKKYSELFDITAPTSDDAFIRQVKHKAGGEDYRKGKPVFKPLYALTAMLGLICVSAIAAGIAFGGGGTLSEPFSESDTELITEEVNTTDLKIELVEISSESRNGNTEITARLSLTPQNGFEFKEGYEYQFFNAGAKDFDESKPVSHDNLWTSIQPIFLSQPQYLSMGSDGVLQGKNFSDESTLSCLTDGVYYLDYTFMSAYVDIEDVQIAIVITDVYEHLPGREREQKLALSGYYTLTIIPILDPAPYPYDPIPEHLAGFPLDSEEIAQHKLQNLREKLSGMSQILVYKNNLDFAINEELPALSEWLNNLELEYYGFAEDRPAETLNMPEGDIRWDFSGEIDSATFYTGMVRDVKIYGYLFSYFVLEDGVAYINICEEGAGGVTREFKSWYFKINNFTEPPIGDVTIPLGANFLFPVEGGIISDYGEWDGGYIGHMGIDISAPKGSEIFAAESGEVIFADWGSGYGNYVIIDHGNGISTLYGQCDELLVSLGEQVERGQVIAKVGSTGWSTGPHLHFEVRVNGEALNPMDYLDISADKRIAELSAEEEAMLLEMLNSLSVITEIEVVYSPYTSPPNGGDYSGEDNLKTTAIAQAIAEWLGSLGLEACDEAPADNGGELWGFIDPEQPDEDVTWNLFAYSNDKHGNYYIIKPVRGQETSQYFKAANPSDPPIE